VLRWTERLLVIAGAAMLAWSAVVIADAVIAQRAARLALETTSSPTASAPAEEPAERNETLVRPPALLRGDAIASLSIPRVDLSAVVLHGSDARTLRRGPGHLESSALPGEAGNMVIAGHRDSFFRPLRGVRRGDDIFVDTPGERFHYRVTSLDVVDPHDVSVLESTDHATLTLITCYPFWVLGHAPDRFIVRATRIGEPAAPALAMAVPFPRESTLTPAVREPAASAERLARSRETFAVSAGDETLVREAIERFRVAYNSRLISHGDVRPGGPLRFQACNVDIRGDRAAAACEDPTGLPDDRETAVWTFTLERADSQWAIRSAMH
jgi:sortase A